MTFLQKIFKIFIGLFEVKTIVTIAIVFTLCFLAIRGEYLPSEFLMIAVAVVTYYFCGDDGRKIILIVKKPRSDIKSQKNVVRGD